MTTDNRTSLLTLLRALIDGTLGQAQAAMAQHVAQVADNAALAPCTLQLHQVYGALRMVRLDGATRYCTELESALRNAMRSAAADKSEIENISRAIGALREFLNDVCAGGAYIPLRLFPAYRELARVSGNESATEKDLFFPDASDDSPAHPEPRSITAGEIPALLKELRSRYQRGLLGWLKASATTDGLSQMRDVLDTLHKVAAQLPEPQGLWWAAAALIEAVIEALPDAQSNDWIARVKPVCSRIDFLLRDLAARADADTSSVHRDVLYAIASARVVTPRLREVRACFRLDSFLPEANQGAGAGSTLKPALDDVRARFENIKDTWTEYASGEPKRLERFRAMLIPLTEKTRELGNAPLVQLLEAISAATAHLPEPYPLDGQIMSLEMASALLMGENIVHHFDTLPDDLEQQVTIMRGWLADAMQGKISTTSPPGLRADIVQKVNDAKLRVVTAREILKALAQVEKTIEAFTRDRTQHDTLTPLVSALRQVSGVFLVSNQKRAARLATVCQRLIERCANPAHTTLDQDIEWVAEGLGSLGFYLEPCQYGKLPAERAVNMFFTRYEQQAGNDAILLLTQSMPAAQPAVDVPVTAAMVPAHPPAPPIREGVDREMLDVFLEEVNEVLETISTSSAQLHSRHDDHDALLSLRRAFHTLKGSARMVGLGDFGESAWEMEQVLNTWREQSLDATPELLALVKDSRELLSEWAYALQGDEDPGIDAAGIAARARQLRGEPAEPTAAVVAAPVESPAPAATPASVPAAPADDFMTMVVPNPQAEAPTPRPATKDFMTLVVQPQPDNTAATLNAALTTAAPVASEPPSPAATFEQVLTDLGDRLAWLNGLVDEIRTQSLSDANANVRLQEIAHMMQESMAEAGALHRTLSDQAAALTRRT